MSARSASFVPASLHTQVWRGLELAGRQESVASGHRLLEPHLPDAGWPLDGMVEILQEKPGRHVWQLLAPGLALAARERSGPVVLVGAPHEPFGPALAARGLAAERLLCIRADKAPARLWSTEQALRCADVAAVLSWLPQARNPELRRLHMAAQQHQKLFFVFRGLQARGDASPARLRLVLTGTEEMKVHIIKRRGPPMAEPIALPARNERLAALLQSRQKHRLAPASVPAVRSGEVVHALDSASASA